MYLRPSIQLSDVARQLYDETRRNTSSDPELQVLYSKLLPLYDPRSLRNRATSNALVEPETGGEMELDTKKVRIAKHSKFQETLAELMPATHLVHDFKHKVVVAHDYQTRLKKCERTFIQIRICEYHSSSQNYDAYPPNLMLTVNETRLELPEKPAPVMLSKNEFDQFQDIKIHSTWKPAGTKNSGKYIISVHLVQIRNHEQLLDEINILPLEETKKMIINALKQPDDDVQILTPVEFKAICPHLNTKMTNPCRGLYCTHLNCFDAGAFFALMENNPFKSVQCPVCHNSLYFKDLRIDEYFKHILATQSRINSNKVKFLPDGAHEWQLALD